MNDIQLVMEVKKRDVLLRAWEWPEPGEILRACLKTTPSHPRAPLEFLEALSRWQGQQVHAAVVVGREDGSSLNRLFPDLFEPEPTAMVRVSFIKQRPCGLCCGHRPPGPSPWAQLLKRVLDVDALECPKCQTPMVVLAFLTDPRVLYKILDHLKLPSSPPETAPARLMPQEGEMFGDGGPGDAGFGGIREQATGFAAARAPP